MKFHKIISISTGFSHVKSRENQEKSRDLATKIQEITSIRGMVSPASINRNEASYPVLYRQLKR